MWNLYLQIVGQIVLQKKKNLNCENDVAKAQVRMDDGRKK